jgi:ketosteroid isomerase-like protein
MADPQVLKELNHDIWHPFRRAYAERDVEAFVALYTPDLIRAGGPTAEVYGFDRYAAETAEWFASVTTRGADIAIDFRFFERIASGDLASERGCYRIDAPDARVFYGRFHTFSRKQHGVWRIAVDYDTNDGGTVDADTFAAGAGIDDTASRNDRA